MVIRTLLVWLSGIPFTLVIFPFVMLCFIFDRTGNGIHFLGRYWMRTGLFLGGIKVKVTGAENIVEGPKIYMANHIGSFDILALQGCLPDQFRWVAKKSLFSIPVIGWSMTMAGHIPIDRGSAKRAVQSIDVAAKKIHDGRSVLIFPEGVRNTSEEPLLNFKRGGFIMAEKSEVPIVPVSISGTRDIAIKGTYLIHPAHATVHIGKPIETIGRDIKELTTLTEIAIKEGFTNNNG